MDPINTKNDILIVDESVDSRRILRQMLEKVGLIGDEAESGLHALSILEKKKYSLVLIREEMPRMRAIEVIGLINEKMSEDCFKELIVLSSHGPENLKNDFNQYNNVSFIYPYSKSKYNDIVQLSKEKYKSL